MGSSSTAKLILKDGRLEEFSYPVEVSDVLQIYDPSYNCFICNSDEMDFNDVVCAVDGDEILQPGQLYFALPLSWLGRRLEASEMAALAVKASSALMKSGVLGCPSSSVHPLNLPDYREAKSTEVGGDSGGRRRTRRRRSKGKFAAVLTAIPE